MIDKSIRKAYQQYNEGDISRRDFLEKLARLAGGIAAAYALLPVLEDDYLARAQIIAVDDSRLETGYVSYNSGTQEIRAYQALPRTAGKYPSVLVVHENRGLNPHIEDVTRRVAVEDYLALAPDALSGSGGSPEDPQQAREMIGKLEPQQTTENFVAAVAYLKTHPQATGKVGVVGFCWGGALANQLAVHSADIGAAVPYYGKQPDPADVARITAPLLLHSAGADERINTGIESFENALKENRVRYKIYIYDGAKHAFNNDTNPERYHKEAAELAWKRTMEFFGQELKS